MKTNLGFIFFLISFNISLIAQNITVIKQYSLKDVTAYYPKFDLSGSQLLFTSESYNGINLYNLTNDLITPISNEAGAGYEPIFDNECTKVFYRKTSYINNRKFDAIECFSFTDNKRTLMLSPKRDVKQAKNFHNGFIVTAERKLIKSTFGKTTLKMPVYVTTQDLKIFLYKNDIFQILNPLNEKESRYLWVTLSPNNKMILFTAAGKGTFICDLSGKIISSLGYLNAPVWYDDNYIVGMQDKDDGSVIVSSKVMMMSITGKVKSQISLPNEIAMYPSTAAKASKIAYNTLDGKIRIAEIAIK